MSPLLPATPRASIVPDMLMAWRAMSRAAAAESCTVPPRAEILPLLLTSGLVPSALVGIATCRKPSPEMSSVACSPEPSATLPIGTLMTPELATVPPISAM